MCLLFETIKAENGVIYNIDYHQKRVDKTFAALFTGHKPLIISEIISNVSIPLEGLFRVRISYDSSSFKHEIFPYKKREINSIVIFDTNISYPYKYKGRELFMKYINITASDSEPLFAVNRLITDTTFSNTAFYDGNRWYTPNTFLLQGTKREFYLNKGILSEIKISISDIKFFEKISLINSMCDIGDITIDTENIYNNP